MTYVQMELEKEQEQNTVQEVDILFSIEEARKPFQNYCRSTATKDCESLIISLAVFDAVTTRIVESFKGILRDKGNDERYISEKTRKLHRELKERAIYSHKRYVRFGKE